MAIVIPVVSNSQALITPGWPLAAVAHANPLAGPKASPTPDPNDAIQAAKHAAAKAQAGVSGDRTR